MTSRTWSTQRVLVLPAVAGALVATFALFTRDIGLQLSLIGATVLLLAWCVALVRSPRATRLTMPFVPKRQHWLQACAQGTLMLYWAAHTPFVARFLPFLLIQLLFAYAFDSLLTWSRRDEYILGFAPFPVIFSINLFLSFRPHWFYWQFLMIALGFAAKEFIKWEREGRRVHIFNPSSFPLGVFSLALLLTGTTALTNGVAIANSQSDTPYIYLAIFLVALPGQILFGVARMTMSAALTMFLIGLAYLSATGTYLFYDSYIPAAVFLGMHLLFTDPSTSPRSGGGRVIFGMLYSILTIAFFLLLESLGQPSFYDKLLPVPIMNLLVPRIDRLAKPVTIDRATLGQRFGSIQRNIIYTSLWAASFVVLNLVQGVGDKHPGQYLPFWRDACGTGSTRACEYVAKMMIVYCRNGSGWACNEEGRIEWRVGRSAEASLQRACQLGFTPGCENVRRLSTTARGEQLASDDPQVQDWPVLAAGTKSPLTERDPAKLEALACAHGWTMACNGQR